MAIDKFGRLVIPKAIRDDFGLKPGDELDVMKERERIVLRPLKKEGAIVSKDGILVITGVPTEDIASAVRHHRNERIDAISGRMAD